MATDDKVSIIVTSTDTNGTVKQKSYTYISPDATNGQLKTFAQAANSLTKNTYNGSRKVTQVNLDTADPGGGKQDTTLTLDKTSCTLAEITAASDYMNAFTVTITTNSDGDFYIKQPLSNYLDGMPFTRIFTNGTSTQLVISKYINSTGPQNITAPQTITIYQAESATYKAASVDFTITTA